MGVAVAENEQKLVWKECRRKNYRKPESGDATYDSDVKQPQLACFVAAGERWNQHIRQQVAQNCENHRESAERPDLSNRAYLVCKDADQKNRDLSLNAVKQRVRR